MRTSWTLRATAVTAMRAISSLAASSRSSAAGCSKISARKSEPGERASACDTGLPCHEDALDPEVVVEHHHVGCPADPEAAEISEPEDSGGHERCGLGCP